MQRGFNLWSERPHDENLGVLVFARAGVLVGQCKLHGCEHQTRN